MGTGEAVARITDVSASGRSTNRTTSLLHHDRRGDLLAAIDTGGTIQSHFVYGAFGEILWGADPTTEWRRRYNGKEQDQIEGFVYYGHRYYDPITSQWSSTDPLYLFLPEAQPEYSQRLNLYSFSLNNPIRLVDPNGLATCGDYQTETTCAREEGRSLGLRGALLSLWSRLAETTKKGYRCEKRIMI
jgi:RHS repeat-associated protein